MVSRMFKKVESRIDTLKMREASGAELKEKHRTPAGKFLGSYIRAAVIDDGPDFKLEF